MSDARRPALAVLCAGALMTIVDETIVAVSLPVIQRDLGFSRSGLAWVTGAYLIAFAGLLLLSGRLGDLAGRRRVFLTGLVVFTLASAACGLAPNAPALVAARFAQGVGAAAMTAVVLGMIVTLYPGPRERVRAIGVFSFVQATGGSIGTLAGGLITEYAGWHWIFGINVPIGVVAFLLARRVLVADAGTVLARGADVPGAALVTGALMTAVYAIITVERHGWASVHTLVAGALALILLGGFLARQAKAAEPLLPLLLFASRPLSGMAATLFLLVAAMFGFMFLAVLHLREVFGYGARQTGLAMLPVALAIAVVSLGLAARLAARFGERRVLPAGLALVVAGLLLLARAPADAGYVADLLPALLALGCGFGLALPALLSTGMAGASPDAAGLASGLFATVQQIGAALGLSVLAVLAAARTGRQLAGGVPEPLALLAGYRLGYLAAAGMVLVALTLAAFVLRPGRPSESVRARAH